MSIDDLYRPHLLDHYGHPRNRGRLEDADLSAGVDVSSCGDTLHLGLVLNDDGLVHRVGWEGEGCLISMACASIFSERIKSQGRGQLETLGDEEVLAWYDAPLEASRRDCALLPLRVLRSALGSSAAPTKE